MNNLILIAQIIIAALIIVTILMQNRSSGLGAVFGGGGAGYHTKRGLEKGLHIATIVLVILFVLVGVINLIFKA